MDDSNQTESSKPKPLPPAPRTLEDFFNRVGWLDEPFDDFMDIMRERDLDKIPQGRILFEENDPDNG